MRRPAGMTSRPMPSPGMSAGIQVRELEADWRIGGIRGKLPILRVRAAIMEMLGLRGVCEKCFGGFGAGRWSEGTVLLG